MWWWERETCKAIAGTSLFTKFLAAEGLSRSFLGLNRPTPLINLSHVFTLGLSHPLLGPKTTLEFFLSPTRRHGLPAAPFATSLLCVFPFAVPASLSQTLSQTCFSLRHCSWQVPLHVLVAECIPSVVGGYMPLALTLLSKHDLMSSIPREQSVTIFVLFSCNTTATARLYVRPSSSLIEHLRDIFTDGRQSRETPMQEGSWALARSYICTVALIPPFQACYW
jgi:hypothetical protein